MKRHLTLIIFVLCIARGARASAQAAYDVTLLGVQNSFGLSNASGLNRWGQIIGQDSSAFNPQAQLWTPTTANGTTGTLYGLNSASGFPAGASSSWATGINDRGQVVGSAYTPGQGDGNQTQTWMWRPSPLNDLKGTALNGTRGKAVTFPLFTIPSLGTGAEYNGSINNSGTIAAYGMYYHPLLFSPSPANSLTGNWTYEPNYCAPPSAINDAGQIAGGTCESATENVPYVHSGAFPMAASDLLNSPLWEQPPTPNGIGAVSGLNKNGHMSISAASGTVAQIRAYLYRNGTAIDVSGGQDTRAYGLNRYDQVVGAISATSHASLFENGMVIDLNTVITPPDPPVGYWLKSAIRINDVGQILCNGLYFNGGPYGTQAAFLLTPAVKNPTAQITVVKGAITQSGNQYKQTVTLTNNGKNIAGPISLVLDGLASGITLTHLTGTTVYTGPVGSQYTNIRTGGFAQGTTITATIVLSNPSHLPISYTARILAGPAPR